MDTSEVEEAEAVNNSQSAAVLTEFDRDEWWDVMRRAKPDITREAFDAYWDEFHAAKAKRAMS